jgi:uncharacterized protein HemX
MVYNPAFDSPTAKGLPVKTPLSNPTLLLCTFLIAAGAQAEMYKWTDEQGNVHFSDKPHANARKLEIRTPRSSGIGASNHQRRSQQDLLRDMQASRQQREQKAAENARAREQRERECTALRNRLRTYEEVDYVFYRDDSGKKKRLSRDYKKKEEQKLREQIAQNC